MPSVPSAGLLVFCRGPRAAIEVLLLERSSATRGTGGGVAGVTYRVPSWEHRGGALEDPPPPGLSIEERLRHRPRQTKPKPDDLLATARAGFAADFGLSLEPPFQSLGGVKQHHHRLLYVWACGLDTAAANALRRGIVAGRPAALVGLSVARRGVVPAQQRFVDQLSALVSGGPTADR